jgi:pyruvate-formate lyase-activating enzyme
MAPRGVTVELTDRCNLRCGYCPKGSGIGVHGGDIDLEFFKTIIDEAATLGMERVGLVGFGEPLCYPHLTEAIRYVKSKYPSTFIFLTTNGILLDTEMSSTLIHLGLDQMTISVNFNSRQKYLEWNRADLFDKVVTNTKMFLQSLNADCHRRKPRTLVQIMDSLNSPLEICAFRKFWEPYLEPNAAIQVQPFSNWGGLIEGKETSEEHHERYPCTHLQNNWIITREGNALACCMVFPYDRGNELILGNVGKEGSLRHLYLEGKIIEMKKNNMNCDYRTMPLCRICDAYRTVPNIYLRNPFYPRLGNKWL